MQALQLSNGQLNFRTDYPAPQPASGEALIRVSLAGICATDLELINGYKDFNGILGHEFVGRVTAVGDCADSAWINTRVVGSINIGCMQCSTCLSTGPAHCPQRNVLGIIAKDGAFAEYITLPVGNLFTVPDAISDQAAVFTEPLAAACRIREQILIKPSINAAVIGPGRLGLLVGKVLALTGIAVTMLGRHQQTLELPTKWGLKTALVQEQIDNSYDVIVAASGNSTGLQQALRLIRPLGTLILKSTFPNDISLGINKIVVAEITVLGSRCGPFAPALRLLHQQTIDVQSCISAEFPLSDALTALQVAKQPCVRKVLLRP